MSQQSQAVQAAVCRSFGAPLTFESVELAPPSFGEVQVAIKAVAICHSDITFIDGKWGGQLPAVYGHEAAGIVQQVGPGGSRFAPGDRVIVTLIRSCGSCHYCADGNQVQCESQTALDQTSPIKLADGPAVQGMRTGAFAEAVTVDASQIVKIDDDLPFELASLLACGVITGYCAVTNTVDMPHGSTCAVVGCGGVGLNAVQAAAHQGARTIVAIDVEPGKLEIAKQFGATHTLDARASDLVEQVKALTGGRGLDYVFVTVGLSRVMDQAHTLLARSGTVVLVGMPPSGEETRFDAATFAAMGQKVIGSKMGSVHMAKDIPGLIDMHRQGRLKLKELISNRYRFDQINEALDDARQGRSLRNVVLFD